MVTLQVGLSLPTTAKLFSDRRLQPPLLCDSILGTGCRGSWPPCSSQSCGPHRHTSPLSPITLPLCGCRGCLCVSVHAQMFFSGMPRDSHVWTGPSPQASMSPPPKQKMTPPPLGFRAWFCFSPQDDSCFSAQLVRPQTGSVGENENAAIFEIGLPFKEWPSMPCAVPTHSAGQATGFLTHGAQGLSPPPRIHR